ncbi:MULTISPECIES: M23 family metallopeptidase [Lysobacter]|uniref:M23 family metallopeptidase n=1 Tax=Lysobacter TaxID=68 RepID=UPI001F3DF127|nr:MULTISPECIES: M23 family metallopeptidase [Lysobacter]UJB18259.1 M23 family metallopeptidase [Lysobacter capsici]UJQ28018.1 M23 family metallopeptidase [Lysobacter gummosus]
MSNKTGSNQAFSKMGLALLTCCVLAAISGGAGAAERGLSGQDLVYSYDEMFDFDIDAYLAKNAPHLSRHAESISHWAGYSGISPKVLIALMEQQSGAITRRHAAADAAKRPFGALAKAKDFNGQTREVAQALREALYENDGPDAKGAVTVARANPLQALFERAGASQASAKLSGDGEFQLVYGRLFNEPRQAQAPSARFAKAGPDVQPLSPNGLLQFPFPRGARWHVGGAHTNTGSGNYPMSSLDMSLGGGWGSNQSNTWVSASANGSFKRHSSCFAEIVHSGGWSTTYYHLMNIRYNTGANVGSNTAIANPANTRAQALCNGGSSTGPHEHWSLKLNGSFYHLNGAYLSGYRITATGSSYDTNCSRFYLAKNGQNYCSGWFTNPGH